jgi:hypothetical protein
LIVNRKTHDFYLPDGRPAKPGRKAKPPRAPADPRLAGFHCTLEEKCEWMRRRQEQLRQPRRKCANCGDTGKVDRGNGTTKPCDCAVGVKERERRAQLKRGKR